jgi:hypothetical protein
LHIYIVREKLNRSFGAFSAANKNGQIRRADSDKLQSELLRQRTDGIGGDLAVELHI